MIKISTALREVIARNQLFEWGLSYKLLNISQLATYIQPEIESRLKKKVTVSAIKMNLSRIQRDMSKTAPSLKQFLIHHIAIHTDLFIITFPKNKETHAQINLLYRKVVSENGYMNITEGTRQITMITEERFVTALKNIIPVRPTIQEHDVIAIKVEFTKDYTKVPGLFFTLIQKVALQGINILELSSTSTELIFYFDKKDMKIAFDIIANPYSN